MKCTMCGKSYSGKKCPKCGMFRAVKVLGQSVVACLVTMGFLTAVWACEPGDSTDLYPNTLPGQVLFCRDGVLGSFDVNGKVRNQFGFVTSDTMVFGGPFDGLAAAITQARDRKVYDFVDLVK